MGNHLYPQPTSGRPSNSLHFVVGEMNGKLDQLIASLLPTIQAIQADHSSLEQRVVVLEAGKWQLIGGGSILVILISAWEIIARVYHL